MTPMGVLLMEAGCLARGCVIYSRYDWERLSWFIQHGKNPESRIELPKKALATAQQQRAIDLYEALTFFERCHTYADAPDLMAYVEQQRARQGTIGVVEGGDVHYGEASSEDL